MARLCRVREHHKGRAEPHIAHISSDALLEVTDHPDPPTVPAHPRRHAPAYTPDFRLMMSSGKASKMA